MISHFFKFFLLIRPQNFLDLPETPGEDFFNIRTMLFPERVKVIFCERHNPVECCLLPVCQPEFMSDSLPEDVVDAWRALIEHPVFKKIDRAQVTGGRAGYKN